MGFPVFSLPFLDSFSTAEAPPWANDGSKYRKGGRQTRAAFLKSVARRRTKNAMARASRKRNRAK